MDVELHVRERPARGQIFQRRSRGGFDALAGENRKDASSLERAMEKQPLSEAAINSSGLVPMPSAKEVP